MNTVFFTIFLEQTIYTIGSKNMKPRARKKRDKIILSR